jgi:hypothetical protein
MTGASLFIIELDIELDFAELVASRLRADPTFTRLVAASRPARRALALVKMDSIVLDQLTDEKVDVEALRPIVSDFISRRKDSEHYSFDVKGQTILVHSADPIAASKRKTENTLPPNLRQCPYCSFITQYEVEYVVHMRSHLFGV